MLRGRFTLLAVVIGGLLLSLLSAGLWTRTVRDREHAALRAQALGVATTVGTLVGRDTDFEAALHAVLSMNPGLGARGFAAWNRSLRASKHEDAPVGNLLLRPVARDDVVDFVDRRQADPAFERLIGYTPAGIRLSADRRECLVLGGSNVRRISEQGSSAIQQDWCDRTTEIGADQAPMLARATATGDLEVNTLREPGVATTAIFDIAFYKRGMPTRTAAQRRAAVSGWLSSEWDLGALVRRATTGPGVDAVLTHTNPGERSEVIARAGPATHGPRLIWHVALGAGPGWAVIISGVPRSDGLSPGTQGDIVLGVGLLLTTLLALLLRTYARSREQALLLVAEATSELQHRALHDPLTGLPNRTMALERAERMLARARRTGRPMAALYIDIDGFKQINDTFGHPVGDRFLELVAERLREVVRESDLAARMAGDEFAVLVEGDDLDYGPELLAQRILQVLSAPYDLIAQTGRQLSVSASIGIAQGSEADAEQLLANADLALYTAKQAGKNRSVMFGQGMQAAAQQQMRLELDLRDALRNEELALVYQPMFDLRTDRIAAVEVLLRWDHPTRGPIDPAVFVPLAEAGGLIDAIGSWVLSSACAQAQKWRRDGFEIGIAVNVSGRQLDDGDFAGRLASVLSRTGLPADALALEITETALMRDPESTARQLHAIKALGVWIALDDFGTGYSSLTYLQRFPIDILKIDRSFVEGLGEGTGADAGILVTTLLSLGQSLGMLTVAEGIERRDQLQHLRLHGCDYGQGYLFCRPLTALEVEQKLRSGETLHPAAG